MIESNTITLSSFNLSDLLDPFPQRRCFASIVLPVTFSASGLILAMAAGNQTGPFASSVRLIATSFCNPV
ncbi:hypothetical protein L249_3711 [Ophiocordyceps polyrhachis-furcata BCC 54312]|uniref:Uncharacterized protein n=1 Tax=Ophiocordyceps polyrhachis-furcata BCC 54312 TaxID=1330021 RepID=A0A367L4U5_9HYPO|nr:hypothetical protein L249_3711 [Ophiocordyceps polyrhachis-furcata BCC 54312]